MLYWGSIWLAGCTSILREWTNYHATSRPWLWGNPYWREKKTENRTHEIRTVWFHNPKLEQQRLDAETQVNKLRGCSTDSRCLEQCYTDWWNLWQVQKIRRAECSKTIALFPRFQVCLAGSALAKFLIEISFQYSTLRRLRVRVSWDSSHSRKRFKLQKSMKGIRFSSHLQDQHDRWAGKSTVFA